MTGSVTILPPGSDIFASGCEALVSPVDAATGAQGKGLALEFKRRYPEACERYRRLCPIRIGYVPYFPFSGADYELPTVVRPRIFFLATKTHWSKPASIARIVGGLEGLVMTMCNLQGNRGSIAIPALGCGEGRLTWADVEPLLVAAANEMAGAGVHVKLYAPHE